jgi:choline dehydrogenase-like flavoprotein
VTYWPLALELGAELRTECRVSEVTVDENGLATGATYFDRDGRLLHQRASAVVVCANGVGTPRLLLLSQSKSHPNGLANSSGLVGKRLMHHPTGFVTGVFEEMLEDWKGNFAAAIISQHFYETDASRGYKRGFQMQCVRAAGGPVGTAVGQYLARLPWGEDHHRLFDEQFGRTVSLTVTSEDLPEETNCVTLDPVLKDGDGIPAPALHYRCGENTKKMIAWGVDRAVEAFQEAGAKRIVTQQLVESAGFHFLGTARMGDDPATSVLDRFGRAHDCENLWVGGGSVFVTGAGLNPTSTIMALALRTADDILAKRKQIEVAA